MNSKSLMQRNVPTDRHLPLASILNTEIIKATLEGLCLDQHKRILRLEISFVRYNPGVSCVVSYNVLIEDVQRGTTDESIFYISSFAPERSRQMAERLDRQKWVPGAILPAPRPIQSLNAICYQFPNDGAIPGLKLLANQEKLLEIIDGAFDCESGPIKTDKSHPLFCHRLRYKPENRYIARCEFNCAKAARTTDKRKSAFLRFERNPQLKKSFDFSATLFDAFRNNPRIHLPQPLACFPQYNLQLFEWVEAEKLSELLRGPEPEIWVTRAARILGEIHSCEVPDLPRIDDGAVKERMRHTARFLSCASTEFKNFAEDIAESLDSITTATAEIKPGLVHGDFHQGQLLISGQKDYVLDFSRSYWGEQAADMGNFLAQLTYWSLLGRLENVQRLENTFINTYEKVCGISVPLKRLKYWKTVGLLELAMREFRRLKSDWPVMCQKLLSECRHTLNT